jgi:hypothetical protein
MPPTSPRHNGADVARALALGGSALTVLGVVLPWVELRVLFGRLRVSGLDTNPGKLSLAAAGFAALLTLVAGATEDPDARRAFQALCLLPGAAIVFVAAFNLLDVAGLESRAQMVGADAGVGLWLTLVAGFAIFAGAVVSLCVVVDPSPTGGPPPPFPLPGSMPSAGDR